MTVHHGRIFSTAPPPAFTPTPMGTGGAGTPTTPEPLEPALGRLHVNGSSRKKSDDIIHPYLCFGFKIQDQIVYLSDVSHIPEDAWEIIHDKGGRDGPLPLCVLDCLSLKGHISHFGLGKAISTARQIAATRTYFTGFSHAVSHDEYVKLTEVVGGEKVDESTLTEKEKEGLTLIEPGEAIWVRPAHDGLRVTLDQGLLLDDTYM